MDDGKKQDCHAEGPESLPAGGEVKIDVFNKKGLCRE